MWDIAYTDSKIDKYEDYTIRKVSELIYVNTKISFLLKIVELPNFKNSRCS